MWQVTRWLDDLSRVPRILAWVVISVVSALVLILFGALTNTPTLTWTSGLLWVLIGAASGLAGSTFRNRHHV